MTWPLRLLPARKSVLAVPSWAAEWPYGLREVASDLLLRPPGQQYRAHPARAAVCHPSQRGVMRREGTGGEVGVWRGGDAGRFASSAAVGLAEGPAQGRPLRYSAMIPWLLRHPLRLRPPDGDLRRPLPETA